MSKTVTLRLDDKLYQKFQGLAKSDNRPISNFIETAALRFIEELELADEFEMKEIRENVSLNRSLKRGLQDAKERRGRFV
jgi:predicted transcriptional regulator